MPLVFVHGVNVRKDASYGPQEIARNALFRRFLLSGLAADSEKVSIHTPYWGDLAASFAWKHASLPSSDVQVLGGTDELLALLVGSAMTGQTLVRGNPLLSVARASSLERAVDLLWSLAYSRPRTPTQAQALADLAARVMGYVEQNPNPAWLTQVRNDNQLIGKLIEAIDASQPTPVGATTPSEGYEALGGSAEWAMVREALVRLRGGAMTSQIILSAVRSGMHRTISQFLGDAFTYLNRRGTPDQPGAIVTEIISHLRTAQQNICADDPKLIVVAHSMGGNIIYDLLTGFLPQMLPGLQVDILVTVGSQVALFEELKLYKASIQSFPADANVDRVAKPNNVHCWLNVFDLNDALAFATEGVFQDSGDYAYSTGEVLFAAHSGYFMMPSFYQRLSARVRRACL